MTDPDPAGKVARDRDPNEARWRPWEQPLGCILKLVVAFMVAFAVLMALAVVGAVGSVFGGFGMVFAVLVALAAVWGVFRGFGVVFAILVALAVVWVIFWGLVLWGPANAEPTAGATERTNKLLGVRS